MTLRYLKIFIAVYQSGSITKAAKKLYMTQPVVSRSIQELEKYYGIQLFERINHHLSITEAGHKFYSYALHIIDSFDQMELNMKNWDELGIIRVGATVTPGSILLPKVLKEYRAIHPSITVKVTIANGTQLQKMLENNDLDFALIEGGIISEDLTTEELGEDRLILLLPPDSDLLSKKKIYLSDLASQPFLLRENGSVSRILINHIFALHNLSITPIMESVSTHAIVQGVHEGIGLSFLPEQLVKHSVESGFIATKTVVDESFQRKSYIVWHKNKLMPESAKDFIALCHDENKKQLHFY